MAKRLELFVTKVTSEELWPDRMDFSLFLFSILFVLNLPKTPDQMVVALAFCEKTSAVFALSAHKCPLPLRLSPLRFPGHAAFFPGQARHHLGHRLLQLLTEVPCGVDDVPSRQ